MIAADFSGRPDGYSDWTCPPKRTVQSAGLTAGSPLPKLPSQHAMHEDGPPMEGLLRAIRRLDHSPVRVQADELATGDIPQQPGAAQSAERALPVAAEQAHGVPAGRGGARGPVRRGGHEGLAIAVRKQSPASFLLARVRKA